MESSSSTPAAATPPATSEATLRTRPPVSSDVFLKASVTEVVQTSVGPPSSIRRFDGYIDEHLTRNDGVIGLLDGIRAEVNVSVDEAFPQLMKTTAELLSLYAVIDSAEEAVDRVHASAQAAADRLDVLQKGYSTKYPDGLQKIATWFGVGSGGGGGQKAALDAPLSFPPWDRSTATISATAEISKLDALVGLLGAIESPVFAAASQEETAPTSSSSSSAAESTPSGQQELSSASIPASANTAADASSQPPSDSHTATSSASEEKGETPVKKAAISRGEDDEEEDDDDDE